MLRSSGLTLPLCFRVERKEWSRMKSKGDMSFCPFCDFVFGKLLATSVVIII